MLAVLHVSGIILSKESRQIMKSGCARVLLHFLRSIAGKPSGPAAELGCTSLIAFISSSSVNSISTIFSGLDISSGNSPDKSLSVNLGWLKTDAYTVPIGFQPSSLDLISAPLLS